MDELRKIGIDPGFGGVKAAEVRDGAIVSALVPSVVGVGETDAGALGLAGVVRAKRAGVPDVIAFGGVEYLAGANVAHYARPIERMDFARFTDGPELRALFYAALYRLLDGGACRLGLAIGLPVEVLQDVELARRVEHEMTAWLLGRHEFAVNGTRARFEVVQVRARIAQPVATWFEWGLDLAGQWARGPAAARAPCLVIDEGFNTLDLLVVEGGRISTRYTSADRLGMRRAAEIAASNIRRRHGVEMGLHEADELVQTVIGGKRARLYVTGELRDVSSEVTQAVQALGADVLRFVEANVGAGRKFRVLLTGGGALALAGRLLAQYPHGEVMAEPVLANARGLAKLAQRVGFLTEA